MSKSWSETAFEIILNEGEEYLGASEIRLIMFAYRLLEESVNFRRNELSETHLELSLEVTADAAGLGLQGKFLASSLLYFPYVVGALSQNHLKGLGIPESVLAVLESLSGLNATFENYLPWARKLISVDEKGNKKSRYWQTRTSSIRPNAFLAMSPDPETAVLKILERKHLLKLLPRFAWGRKLEKIIAQESLDLFAPVAEAVGMWAAKSQIEDSAFKLLKPELYKEIANDLKERRAERESKVRHAIAILEEVLRKEGLEVEITGRAKHLFGIYQKMIRTGKTARQINDVLAIRVIVDSGANEDEKIQNCYHVLGLLFQTWPPAKGIYENGQAYRDWIRNPKPNGYQSIHTTVIFEDSLLEVQIRTRAMHNWAEFGAAAHWVYKKTGRSNALRKKYQQYVLEIGKFRRAYEEIRNKKTK